MGTVWILNLDAEAELERPQGYSPSRKLLGQNLAHEGSAAKGLLAADDVIWREGEEALAAWRGMGARAWCPTPRTLRRMREAGLAHLGPEPPLQVLRRVNDRQFCAELGQCLPGAVFLNDGSPSDLEGLGACSESAGGWLLKRSFGVSGRGRRKIRNLSRQSPMDVQWIRASLKVGGLQIEPWCDEIEAEFVQEGVVDASGCWQLGTPLLQVCAPDGAWVSCEPAGSRLLDNERDALAQEGERVARALSKAGYSGPFALDAYRARLRAGVRRFVSRSEINARYSMGWSMGSPP